MVEEEERDLRVLGWARMLCLWSYLDIALVLSCGTLLASCLPHTPLEPVILHAISGTNLYDPLDL